MGPGASTGLAVAIRETSYVDLQATVAALPQSAVKKLVEATQETDKRAAMPDDPVFWGMTVQQLFDFSSEIYGGPVPLFRAAYEVMLFGKGQFKTESNPDVDSREMTEMASMSMYDIVQKHVKPKTKGHNVSLAVYLNMKEPLRATTFISHSWAEKFAFFVLLLCWKCFPADCMWPIAPGKTKWVSQREEDLERYLEYMHKSLRIPDLSPDRVIWVCALAIDQNASIDGQLGTDVLQSPFAKVLNVSEEVVIVYNPDLQLYSRVWCVLEGFLTKQRIAKEKDEMHFRIFSTGMAGRREMRLFGDYVMSWGKKQEEIDDWGCAYEFEPAINEFMEKYQVLVEDAQASMPSDREKIMEFVLPRKDEVNAFIAELRKEQFIDSFDNIFEEDDLLSGVIE